MALLSMSRAKTSEMYMTEAIENVIDPRIAEESEALFKKALISAGIEEEQSKMVLENYDPGRFPDAEEALGAVRNYMENPGGIILFYGPTGVGKTHLYAAIAKEYLR